MTYHLDLHFGHPAASGYIGGPQSFFSGCSGSHVSESGGPQHGAPFVDCRLSGRSSSCGAFTSPHGSDGRQSADSYPSYISVQQTQPFDGNETAYDQRRDHLGNVFGQPLKGSGLYRSNAQRGPYNLRATAQGFIPHATNDNSNASQHRNWNLADNRREWEGSGTSGVLQNDYPSNALRLWHPTAGPCLMQDGIGNIAPHVLLERWEGWVETQEISGVKPHSGSVESGKSSLASSGGADDDVPLGKAYTSDAGNGHSRLPSPVDKFHQLVDAVFPPIASPSNVLGGWYYPPPANGLSISAAKRASIEPPPVPPKIPLEHPDVPYDRQGYRYPPHNCAESCHWIMHLVSFLISRFERCKSDDRRLSQVREHY